MWNSSATEINTSQKTFRINNVREASHVREVKGLVMKES